VSDVRQQPRHNCVKTRASVVREPRLRQLPGLESRGLLGTGLDGLTDPVIVHEATPYDDLL